MTPARPDLAAHETSKSRGSGPHHGHRRIIEVPPITCNELQHLFAALVAAPAGDLAHRLRWSLWRRRHPARARAAPTSSKPTDRDLGGPFGVPAVVAGPSAAWCRRCHSR